MIHITTQAIGTSAAVGGLILLLMLLMFIGIGVGVYQGLKALERAARTKQIEIQMRQAVRDADDQQRIAQKLLRERGL